MTTETIDDDFKLDSDAVGIRFAVALPDTRGRHCYLTDGDGDPPRTYTPEMATGYPTRAAAEAAIIEARKLTPLKPRVMIVVPHPIATKDDEDARHSSANDRSQL